jgi:hypothetical protein
MVLGSQGPGRVGRRRFFLTVGRVPDQRSKKQGAINYFRANPQVFVLLVICVVLGLGTFIAVLVALALSGSGQTTGYPSGAIVSLRAALGLLHLAVG